MAVIHQRLGIPQRNRPQQQGFATNFSSSTTTAAAANISSSCHCHQTDDQREIEQQQQTSLLKISTKTRRRIFARPEAVFVPVRTGINIKLASSSTACATTAILKQSHSTDCLNIYSINMHSRLQENFDSLSCQFSAERIRSRHTSELSKRLLLSIDDLEASDPLRIVLNLHVRTVRETGTGGGTHIFAKMRWSTRYEIHKRRGFVST